MIDELLALPVVTQLLPSVTVRRLGELEIVVVDDPRVRGAVSLQGGQVIAWQPAGHAPGLWLGKRNTWQAGKPVRGGVPLCWPWFGPGEGGKPSHGFARNSQWSLEGCDTVGDGVLLTLRLEASAQTLSVWPHEFTLLTRIALGATCEIEVEAQGAYASTAALHTYVAIDALGTAEVSGLGKQYRDNLLARDVADADSPVTPEGHIEQVYTDAQEVSVIKGGADGQTVEIAHHGASDVVVWNPGAELSASMADLTDEDYRHFLCVETGRINVPLESTSDRPGRLGLTLRVAPRS